MQDEEDLTLEAVPGFDRPMSAGPEDRIVGEDELGRMVYETITGQRYTISRNPDQRTSRTRFVEDTLPAMREFAENPRMPTAEEAVGFAGDVVQGAYESVAGAVRGEGTIGDVVGIAAGAGTGSLASEVPEGSLRLFGGFRAARDPGRDAERRELPQSVGADELPRFEIDDSLANFDINRLPQQNMSSLDNTADRERIAANPGEYFARLDQILEHPELYRQYPELRDLLVVEDTSLRQGVGGTYDPTRNLLSISSRVVRDPDYFRGVLLHEVQHAIQELEGFDRGTNQRARSVAQRADPQIQEAVSRYSEALERFENFDYESRLDDAKIFIGELLDEIEADGLVTADEITFSTPHRTGWEQSLETLAARLGEDRANPTDSYETLLDFYALIRDNPNLVADEDAFESTFGVGLRSVAEGEPLDFVTSLEAEGIVPIDPHRLYYSTEDIIRDTYEARSGEVEARNVQTRLGMSLAQRFNETPASTENVPRGSQWRIDDRGQIRDVTEFNTGGVVSMEEQMSLFEMGGLAGENAAIDPVSGNEVPPGSLAEEVRDDVPAMLSEGEYVVPADVVRYYGVKFFEDLRGQAKSGLTDMERTGRIGGEPVDPTPGDEPLTPEEMAMLQEIAGMAQGGMVKGYQEGGSVDAPFTPTPNYNIPGFSLFSPLQGGTPTPTTDAQTQSVTLYGPSCEVVTLSLPNEQASYDSFIQQGYSTQPRDYCMAAVQREQAGGEGGEPGGYFGSTSGDSGRDYQPLDPEIYNQLRDDPLAFGAAALEGRDLTRLLGGVGMLLNPIIGLAGAAAGTSITARNIAQAQAAVEVARAKGLDTSALEAQIEAYISNLPNATRIAANIFADGTRIAQRFFQTARDMGLDPNVYGPNPLTREWFETDEAFNQAMADSAPEGMSYDSDSGSYVREGSAAPTTSVRPTMRPGERPRATQPPAAPRVAPVSVSPVTSTGVTTPEISATALPTSTEPADGINIVGEMATAEEAAARQTYNPLARLAPSSAVPGRFGPTPFAETSRVLSEQDISDLQAAGVDTRDVLPGDFASLDQARFLTPRETPTLPTGSIPTATQRYFDQFGLPTPNVPTLVGHAVDGSSYYGIVVNDPVTGSARFLRAGESFVDPSGAILVDPRTPQQTTPSPSPAVNTANLPAFAATDRDGVVVRDPVTGQVRRASPGESYRNLDGTVGTVPGGTPTTTSVIPSLDQQVTEAFGMTPRPTTPVNLAGPGMLPPPTRSTTTQPPNLMGTTAFNTTLPPSFANAPMGDLQNFVNPTPTVGKPAPMSTQPGQFYVAPSARGDVNVRIPDRSAGSIPSYENPTVEYELTDLDVDLLRGGGFRPAPTGELATQKEYDFLQGPAGDVTWRNDPYFMTPDQLRGPGMLPPTPTRSTPSVGYGPGQIDPRLARAAAQRSGTVSGGTGVNTTRGGAGTDRLRADAPKPEPIVSRPTPRPSPAPAPKPSAPPPREESDKPAPSTTKQGSQVSQAEADRIRSEKESGGGGGGGKIVCTAMNEAYGFGSYRQAVWLKYSQDNLTPYHEKGYHKIFLPLVDRAYNRGEKNNLFLRKVLENIARHRTADLRAEMQGKKRDKLGRAYRFILEPVCYLVGRFSK